MRNESQELDSDPASAIYIGVVYFIYAVIGIPANFFVVFATFANSNIRKVNVNIFVFSLALGDLLYLICACAQPLYAITLDIRVCKFGGIGALTFVMMSVITPPCLAMSRYATMCADHPFGAKFKFFTTRKGVFCMNGLLWIFVVIFPSPFVIADKFGLDTMGVCGIMRINDSIGLVLYLDIGLLSVLSTSYLTTLFFYRKLGRWIRETSENMPVTVATKETIEMTRNLLLMMKWIMLLPLIATVPATVIQSLLRYDPEIVSTRTARFFMSTVPLCIVLDPFITVYSVRSYRRYFWTLLPRKQVSDVPALNPSNNIVFPYSPALNPSNNIVFPYSPALSEVNVSPLRARQASFIY